MSSPPSITLVIPTRNRLARLRACLESIDEPPEEIVVVDQSDEPIAPAQLPRAVRLVRQPTPNAALARNLGTLRASSPVVAFVDDDVLLEPGWVGALRGALASTPPPVAVFGAILPAPGPGLPYCEYDYPVRRRFHRLSLPWDVGSGGNMAVRRSVLLALGGFPTDVHPSGEDTYVVLRLLRGGHEVLYEPEMRVLHERKPADERVASRGRYGLGMARMLRRLMEEGDPWAAAIGAVTFGSQLRQSSSSDPQLRREGRRYLRAFARGVLDGRPWNSPS